LVAEFLSPDATDDADADEMLHYQQPLVSHVCRSFSFDTMISSLSVEFLISVLRAAPASVDACPRDEDGQPPGSGRLRIADVATEVSPPLLPRRRQKEPREPPRHCSTLRDAELRRRHSPSRRGRRFFADMISPLEFL